MLIRLLFPPLLRQSLLLCLAFVRCLCLCLCHSAQSSRRSASMSTPSAPAAAAAASGGDRAHVSFLVCGTRFDVDRKYKLIKPIGTGAYGVVWSGQRTEQDAAECAAVRREWGVKGLIRPVLLGCLCLCCRCDCCFSVSFVSVLLRIWKRRRRLQSRRSARVSDAMRCLQHDCTRLAAPSHSAAAPVVCPHLQRLPIWWRRSAHCERSSCCDTSIMPM